MKFKHPPHRLKWRLWAVWRFATGATCVIRIWWRWDYTIWHSIDIAWTAAMYGAQLMEINEQEERR
jgi:hypothetical protein